MTCGPQRLQSNLGQPTSTAQAGWSYFADSDRANVMQLRLSCRPPAIDGMIAALILIDIRHQGR